MKQTYGYGMDRQVSRWMDGWEDKWMSDELIPCRWIWDEIKKIIILNFILFECIILSSSQ